MRRKTKRSVAIILSAALVVGTFITGAAPADAAKLKLNKTKLTLKVGEKFTLKVKGKKSTSVKWSSNKKRVATVTKKGVVKAVAKGNAVISAKVAKKKLKCAVKVNKNDNKAKTTDTPVASNVPVSPTLPAINVATATPAVLPTATPAVLPTATPAVLPTATPEATATPTGEPTPTPAYMQEGAFVYDKLDISWIDPEKPMIAFTFDDGPVGNKDTDYSMRIQKVLKDNGCHATFNYVTGKIGNNEAMKDEILRSMENGNEIANHTTKWDSLDDTKVYKDGEAVAEEIENARKALQELTGITDFTLRPPNLAHGGVVEANCNVPLIGCNIISNDWDNATTKEHIIEVTKTAKDGDIVLFHETMPNTAAAVEELVPYFVEQGFQIVSVVELFAAKDIPLFAGNYYNKAEYMEPRK